MAVGTQQSLQLLYALVNNQLPTGKYFVDRFDDATSPKYYGFVTKCADGWYIMRETITGDVHVFDYHLITGTDQSYTSFEDAWTNRASVNYYNIVTIAGLLK